MQSLCRWAMAALSVVFCCASPIVQAAPGDLDTTFGVNGLATTPNISTFTGVVIQPDGKILAIGAGGAGYSSAPFLVRFNTDGSLDSSFGSGGIVQTNPTDAYTSAIAVEDDGKILTAVYTSVVRYSANGILETTFVNNIQTGATTTAIKIQPDGKILVVLGGGQGSYLERYNGDGTYDSTFGNGGIAPGIFTTYNDVAVQSDGKIVVSGGNVGNNIGVARLNGDGSLDSSFGSNGGYVLIPNNNGGAYAVSVQPDGKIVTTSNSYVNLYPAPSQFFIDLRRFNVDGTLDTSFGSGGRVQTPSNDGWYGFDNALQSDGKIVVVGQSTGMFVARYNPDGSLDTQFGSGGIVTTGPGGSGLAVAFQPDGNIVVAGSWTDSFGNGGATVARYLVDLSNTPVGTNVNVGLDFGDVEFSSVTIAGNTTMTESGTGPTPPAGFQTGQPPLYYDIQTTATYTPPVTVCIDYDPSGYADPNLAQLFHYESGAWTDVTTSNDTLNGTICGQVSSLSPFAIFEPSGGFSAQVQPPLNSDGSSVFNANRGVVPVKFTLSSGGQSTCTSPPATIAVFRTGGATNQEISEAVYSSSADDGLYYRITGCEYHYNLNAKALGKGTYLVQILINNAVVGSATFGLK